jgi:hypothetical protein
MANLDDLKQTAQDLQSGLGDSSVLASLILASAIRDASEHIAKAINESSRKYMEFVTQKQKK